MDCPRPSGDTGIGAHSDPNAYYKPPNFQGYADDLWNHGIRWWLSWYFDENKRDFIRVMRQRGIEVIGRPGPAKMPRPNIDIVNHIEAYIAVGVRWFVLGNEYNLHEEWDTADNWKGFDKPVRHVAEWYVRMAAEVRKRGAWPLTPPPSLGGHMNHREWFVRFMTAIQNIASERGVSTESLLYPGGIGLHCRSVGNPLSDGPENYDCSAREWEWFDDVVRSFLGRSLPMANTEAFDEPQWLPKVGGNYDWDLWKRRNLEQMRWFNPNNDGYRYPPELLCNCFWLIHADKFSPWPQCGLVSNYPHFVQRGDYNTDLWKAMSVYINWNRESQPEPEPEPQPEPQPEVKMRAYLKDGTEVEPQQLLDSYSVTIEPIEQDGYGVERDGFRVIEIRERCEAANCDIWVRGMEGEIIPNQLVRWGWPGTEVEQATGPDGRVGFPMAASAYYDPLQGGGPHWTAVRGTSETVRGIGMVAGTVHCTLNYVFQYTHEAPQPEPEPEPEPVPEPEPEPKPTYNLLAGLERLGLKVEDMRQEVRQVSKVDEIPVRPFGHIVGIVVHHTGSNAAQTPMGIVDYHMKTRGWPTVGYHFLQDWDGDWSFLAPLAWETPHCGYLNPETIGIALMGDFTENPPSQKRIDSLRLLIYSLQEWMGQNWGQYRHCYVLPHNFLRYQAEDGTLWRSSCPGKLKWALTWNGIWPELPSGK